MIRLRAEELLVRAKSLSTYISCLYLYYCYQSVVKFYNIMFMSWVLYITFLNLFIYSS